MKQITFYLDFISPYAYLAFEALPVSLQGLSYSVVYKPVFLGGLLKHHGQLGPAEIPDKRAWVYRHVQWLAMRQNVPLQMPASHPFNPLALLRLALACDAQGTPNRHVCETLFRHVWVGGADAADGQRLQDVTAALAPQRGMGDADVKAQLLAQTDAAAAAGVFGVPAFVVDDKVFWGLDALPMLRDYVEGDAWFEGAVWGGVRDVPSAIPLRKSVTSAPVQ